ncbi:MAG: glycosyltransferase [Halarcobacter sp.]
MKIPIITVVLNGAKTIRGTIESVLSQTYDNIEYIVIDEESIDDTMDIINEYQNKISKSWKEKKLNGVYFR